jgi:hypothetical protein
MSVLTAGETMVLADPLEAALEAGAGDAAVRVGAEDASTAPVSSAS